MKQQTIRAPGVPDGPPGSYSACKKVGDLVFIAGTVAWDKDIKPRGRQRRLPAGLLACAQGVLLRGLSGLDAGVRVIALPARAPDRDQRRGGDRLGTKPN